MNWIRQLDDARSVAEVVAVARDYLASWTPTELARLPRACRPGRLRDETDIEELHERGVDEYRMTRASGDELTALQVWTGFLANACVRIAQLRGNPAGDAGEADSMESPPQRLAASRDR